MKYTFLLSLLVGTSLMAQEPDSSSAIFKMREAERNFAKASAAIGRNAAFAEYFAERSFIYANRWLTNGQQYSRERKASPVVLKWEPEFMDIASSGDFGVSTGPWEAQEYRPNTAPVATGYFLTVWKKQADGKWKVLLDGGSETPVTKNINHTFSFPAGADKVADKPLITNSHVTSAGLLAVEGQLITQWSKMPVPETYLPFLASDSRIQLRGHLPTTDRDSIRSFLAGLNKTTVWKTEGSDVASSDDLGFTYGILLTNADTVTVKGHYVRIWKKVTGQTWRIMIEMINPD
jgi:hypothetical protein